MSDIPEVDIWTKIEQGRDPLPRDIRLVARAAGAVALLALLVLGYRSIS